MQLGLGAGGGGGGAGGGLPGEQIMCGAAQGVGKGGDGRAGGAVLQGLLIAGPPLLSQPLPPCQQILHAPGHALCFTCTPLALPYYSGTCHTPGLSCTTLVVLLYSKCTLWLQQAARELRSS